MVFQQQHSSKLQLGHCVADALLHSFGAVLDAIFLYLN
jgi:hypothetical protein